MNQQAEKIKTEIAKGFNQFTPNPMMTIATEYILSIDNPDFWIDEASYYIDNPINLIMELTRIGLRIKGLGFDTLAKMDQKTGEIIITKITL